jgi:drug/metabolite transporter (DMT)-like permease
MKNEKIKRFSLNNSIANFSVISDCYFPIKGDFFEHKIKENNKYNENFEIFESLISLKEKKKKIIIQNNLKSIILLFISNFLFSITNLIGKTIGMYYPEVNINACNFFRGFFAFTLSLIYSFYYKINLKEEFKDRSYLTLFKLIIRCICGATSQILFFLSLKFLRISSAYTIFCISPLMVTILTWIFLNGKFTKMDIIALIICFFSVCLITKPQFLFGLEIQNLEDSTIGCIFALFAAFVNSFAVFMSKLVSNDFNLIIQPLMLGIFYMLECFILLCFEDTGFETLSFTPILLTVFFSISFWFNLLIFVYGLSLGDPIKVISIQYSGIVFGLLYNIFIYKTRF